MKLPVILFATAAALAAGPALAEGACVRPTAPTVVDGATATMEQLTASKNEVVAFMGASDAYQTCVYDDLAKQRAAAKENKTKLDPQVAKTAQAEVEANQADKEKAGADFNAAAKAYKAAHPG